MNAIAHSLFLFSLHRQQFHCFINHACNAANNVGHNLTISEGTADPETVAQEILEKYSGEHTTYNPAADRQIHYYSSATPIRDISANEELFDNYIAMSGKLPDNWRENIADLKAQCQGEGVGVIRAYDAWDDEEQQK